MRGGCGTPYAGKLGAGPAVALLAQRIRGAREVIRVPVPKRDDRGDGRGGRRRRGSLTPDHQDHAALAEIELCGELMIAASAAKGPLSAARIDEVLRHAAVELDDVTGPTR